jgi:hypothetical protein
MSSPCFRKDYREFLVSLKGRNFYNNSWRSLVIDIERDTRTCYDLAFQHLNWLCIRGDLNIAGITAIEDQSELVTLWPQLQSPFKVNTENIIG